jgi:uncharacterized membrane protein
VSEEAAMSTENVEQDLSQQLLGAPYEQLSPLQKSVVDLLCADQPSGLGKHLDLDDRTYWQRLADRVAEIGGSWGFIFSFGAFLVLWMGLNVLILGPLWHRAFDPYPFIFLNLMLSMLAAIQAPVIMMSQNRAATKDRLAAEHDYMTNLRAELDIMRLHDKLDAIRTNEIEALLKQQSEALKLLKQEIGELRRERSGK